MDAVVWLEEVGKNDLSTVGGKGASLGEMIKIGVPVPGGFAVTAQAFRDFINRAGIAKELFEALNVDVNQETELHKAEKTAKKLIMDAKVPKDIEQAIKSRYEELCKREGEQVFVAVRSSATAEDLPDASFAGQQETYPQHARRGGCLQCRSKMLGVPLRGQSHLLPGGAGIRAR